MTHVSPRAGARGEVPIRVRCRPFDMAMHIKSVGKGRNAEDGMGQAFNMAGVY